MTYDTMESAYRKAREAQRRGLNTVELAIPANRNTMALRVDVAELFTDGKDVGVDALVVRRLNGEAFVDQVSGVTLPGKIETLIVRASVADVLDMARAEVEREVQPLRPVRKFVRRRALSHLLSR